MGEIRKDAFGNNFCGFYSVNSQQFYEVWQRDLSEVALFKIKYEAAHVGTWPRTNSSYVYLLRSLRPGRDVVYVGKTEMGGRIRPTSHGDDWDYCYILTVSNPTKAIELSTDVLLTLEDRFRDLLDDDSRYENTTKKTTKVVLDDRQRSFVENFMTVALQLLNYAKFPIGLRGTPKGMVKSEGELHTAEEVMNRVSEEEEILKERINRLRNGQSAVEVMESLDEDDNWDGAQKLFKAIEMVSNRKAIALSIPEEGLQLCYENEKKRSVCRAMLYHDPSKRGGIRFVLKKGSVICPEEYFSKSFKNSSEYRGYLKHVKEGDIVNGTVVKDLVIYPSWASSWSRGCISHGYSDWQIVGAGINLLDFFG